MWKWILAGALIGIFLLHPFVMIINHIMHEPMWGHGHSVLNIVYEETMLSFSPRMMAWSLLLAFLGAIIGLLYGREKQLNRTLRNSEKRYRDLVYNIPGMIYRGKPDWSMKVSQNCEKVCSYSADEFMTQKTNWTEIIHPDDTQRVFGEASELMEKPLSIVQEYRIIAKDGSTQWVRDHKTSVFNEDGSYIGVDGIVFDITVSKRAEDLVRETENKYQNLFESSRDAIMTLAPPTWLFTSGNPATVHLFKVRDEAEFISLGPWQLSPERQPDGKPSDEKAKEMIETAMRHGSHFFEWTHCHFDGTPFPAEVLLTRMEKRAQVFLQATVRNITERKQAEEEREILISKLQKTLSEVKTLRGFLPICSHCKKIRDDKGFWNKIESYIHKRSDAKFSHSICPECEKKHFPEYADDE